MASLASGPPERLTKAERMSLSRSLSSAPPMAITGPAEITMSGLEIASCVSARSFVTSVDTIRLSPHHDAARQQSGGGIRPLYRLLAIGYWLSALESASRQVGKPGDGSTL